MTLLAGFMIAESAEMGLLIGLAESFMSIITTWAVSPTFSRTQMNLSDSMVRVLKLTLLALIPTAVSYNNIQVLDFIQLQALFLISACAVTGFGIIWHQFFLTFLEANVELVGGLFLSFSPGFWVMEFFSLSANNQVRLKNLDRQTEDTVNLCYSRYNFFLVIFVSLKGKKKKKNKKWVRQNDNNEEHSKVVYRLFFIFNSPPHM